MSELKLLLMISAQDDFQFIQYFPQSYEQPYKVNELLLYSKFFKKCGKGCLISKDKIYFYKTYVPNIENIPNNNKKRIFLFFYCDLSYKQKYIDEFTENIYDLLDLDAFNEENNTLKKKISKIINDLFEIYKNVNNKEEIYHEYVNNLMRNAREDNSDSHNSSMGSDSSFTRKRIDSRFFRKRENSLGSLRGSNLLENIEMVKINENDTDLTMMFKTNKYDYVYKKLKNFKKIKIINIIIFGIIGLVMICLIPILFKDKC